MTRPDFVIGLAFIGVTCIVGGSYADTLHVPAQYATIQSAIDAAQPGDVVLVADGSYTGSGNQNIDYHGKAISVRSENGPDNCIIDCEAAGRGFYFHTAEPAESILDGFTIRNGYDADWGGGIYCVSSSPTVLNCVITDCSSGYSGGGINCGGQIGDTGASVFSNCTITGNSSILYGGGLCSYSYGARFVNCRFHNNYVSGPSFPSPLYSHGGGIHTWQGDSTSFVDCVISENVADYGGGIYLKGHVNQGTVENCVISGNYAEYEGGGIFAEQSSSLIISTRIVDNTAGWYGGGVCAINGGIGHIHLCTIAGNSAGLYGGGYYLCNAASDINGTIIAGNDAIDGHEVALETQSILWYSYSDIRTVDNALFFSGGSYLRTFYGGNIDADPLFVDSDGPDNDPATWEDNDYHLDAGSPCIDAGDPDFIPESDYRDMDGQWRVWDSDGNGSWRVDMGADEFGSHCPGDLDGDGHVQLPDLAGLLSNYGTMSGATPADGDSDLDGDVDLSDLGALLGVYGSVCDYRPPNIEPNSMVFIPEGEFMMGDTFGEGDSNEVPVHAVFLDAYYIDKYETTNEQYAAALNWAYAQGGLITIISGRVYQYNSAILYCDTQGFPMCSSRITWNGTTFGVVAGKENHPMTYVSWYGAAAYCNWRGGMQGKPLCYNLSTWECDFDANGYRLPTEAEWEKAARGGTPGHRFPWSDVDTIQHSRANYYSYWSDGSPYYPYDTSSTSGYHPLWDIGSEPFTSPVGFFTGALQQKADWGWPSDATSYQTTNGANDYGLNDMAGNASEWCYDRISTTYYSESPYSNPTGPISGTYRVIRGGVLMCSTFTCRVSQRDGDPPSASNYTVGFRCAMGSP